MKSESGKVHLSRYRRLFEFNPIPLFEEDFSEVRSRLSEIKALHGAGLRAYLEQNHDLIFELIGTIKIRDVNKAAVEFHDVTSKTELIGSVTPYRSEKNVNAYLNELLTIEEDKKFNIIEKVIVYTHRKTLRSIDICWMVHSDDANSWSNVIVSFIDNTELHDREEAILRRESLLSEASRLAHLGYYELEFPGGKSFWSPEIYSILGRDPSKVLLSFADFKANIHPDDVAKFEKAITDSLRTKAFYDIEFRMIAADGSIRHLHSVGDPDPVQNEFSQKILGTLMDITTRKQKEIQQFRNQAILAETALLSSLGKLAAGIAHQLFNPLTTIIAESQMVRQMLTPDSPILENINDIEAAGWKAQRIVQLLMEFSQPPSFSVTSIQVNASIEKALRLVGTQLMIEGIAITRDLAEDLPEISGANQRLENLWTNLFLILPSIVVEDFNPALDIRTRFDEKSITISLKADGCKFPLNLISTDALTALETPESQSLIGLEISVCKEIARQLKGTIEVFVEEHVSTFLVTFPRKVDYEHIPDLNR
ncbi:MAG TPA: PAS domain-containing protein [Anaerolineaceae bacterium]|nr:PAS domain-containing protein [Anaerolineaceae bacterium]